MNLKQVTAMIISLIIVIILFLILNPTVPQGITIIILIGLGIYLGIYFNALKKEPFDTRDLPFGSYYKGEKNIRDIFFKGGNHD